MINACTFMTRKCPRDCSYCDASKVTKEEELDWLDWVQINGILKKIGVSFNLILGNETWLIGEKLNRIMEVNQVPYALYTTCPIGLFDKLKDKFFGRKGNIDNLSCGIDYSLTHLRNNHSLTMERKSVDAWLGLAETRGKYRHVDCQGTITLHRQNYDQLPEIVEDLSKMGVFTGINVIHWNKDGKYDFFPSADDMEDFLFDSSDVPRLQRVFEQTLLVEDALIQNREMLQSALVPHMVKTDWHCRGNPYGGPTIDSDGSLRCCGYRKGDRSPEYGIFELPAQFESYMAAVKKDAMECPGCFWSYPWMYHYWSKRDPNFGKLVFTEHASPSVPKEKWADRRVKCAE